MTELSSNDVSNVSGGLAALTVVLIVAGGIAVGLAIEALGDAMDGCDCCC